MESKELKNIFTSKNEAMIRASIDRKLSEIYMTYDKIPIAKHNCSIFRAGGEFKGDPYYWSDEKTLKKIELYAKSLANEYSLNSLDFDDEPVDEEFLNERKSKNPNVYGA